MAHTISSKRALISHANTQIVIVTSVAAFIFVFSLVASKMLASQMAYQSRVLSAKHKAVAQLQSDISAVNNLDDSYKAFVNTPQNLIGGSPQGSGSQDGDNAQIVLDALPSSYDFPALATSLEKIISSQQVTINSITGVDDEANQASNQSSGTPQPVAMPFEISVTGDYQSIQNLIGQFEHSIRPFQVQSIDLSGDQAKLTADIKAQTFYQPAKTFNIGSKVIK